RSRYSDGLNAIERRERDMGLLDRFRGPPSKDKFARMILTAIRTAGEKDPIHYDPEQFQLRQDGEIKCVMNLGNAYQEYAAASKDKRPLILHNVVRLWFTHRRETPTEFEDVKPDLLPGVRSRSYYELTA